MTREQAREFYTETYEETHEPSAFFDRQRKIQADAYLFPYLTGAKRVLDYGCGPGGKLAGLVQRGFDVFGYDINPSFLAFANTKGIRSWDPAAKYDAILLSHTVEHWIHPKADLADLFTANLRPGGVAVVEVPLVDRLILGYRRKGFCEETHLAHVWYFSTATLAALMAELSFELVFSDNVTTCIFRHVEGRAVSAPSSAFKERMRLALIEFSRHAWVGNRMKELNQKTCFVDLGFRSRMIEAHGG